MSDSQILASPPPARFNFSWLTPRRCRALFVVIGAIGFLAQLHYLHHSPIDLSGDEAHYWDWSRRLDLSYYSKGPLVAYIIRASCAIFGNTMPAVRYPALVLAAMTSIVTYLLTFKLFKSDRLALGTVLLNALVPMLVAGSMLMTIDPPFFFCWALATYLLCFALFDQKKWAWPIAGIVIGVGFLAKYAALLWLPGVLLFLLIDRASRPLLKTAGPWVMTILTLLCTTPVIVWNVQHDWVTVRHVARQTGMEDDNDDDMAELKSPAKPVLGVLERTGEFLAGQVGTIGPLIFFMAGGVIYAFGRRGRGDANRRSLQLLATLGGFFFILTMLDAFRGKVQINWPAPAYFTLVILAGYFIAVCLREPDRWKRWRGWAYGTIVFGLLMWPIAHDFTYVYPLIRGANHFLKKPIVVSKMDPTVKLRGWQELGQTLGDALNQMPAGSFILCDDYQQTAETAFYTPGNPITYYAGSYFSSPKRHTQYDLWSDRRLDPPNPLVGHDAIYVGKGGGIPRDVAAAFAHVEPMPDLDIIVDGEKIRMFRPFRCTAFKGMKRPTADSDY